jgi:hypothetical protein
MSIGIRIVCMGQACNNIDTLVEVVVEVEARGMTMCNLDRCTYMSSRV